MSSHPKIFCALDTSDLDQATRWAEHIGPVTGALKVGMEFVNSFGPAGIEAVQNAAPDADLFIDLKFHDIPNTVAGAVRTTCARFAPKYLNVHAAGGRAMMMAAKEACASNTKLLAVTILTSLDNDALSEIGYASDTEGQVIRMAKLAQECGLDGVVCSSHEISHIVKACGGTFETMVPGIRPAGSDKGDQKRTMTPGDAIAAGAHNIVIGRPITAAPDPAKAAADILGSL